MKKRTLHNLSHYHLTSFDMGQLVPIGAVEVLPGDSFQHDTTALIRVTPQVKPLMHPVTANIAHFYVPNRIMWDGWEDFITGESATPPPTISGAAHVEGTLQDYLGVYDDASTDFSALPVRAYNKIFNEYFRDQDLVTEVAEDSTAVQRVAWAKDRFTAARPWPQKGSAVTLPLGTSAPITGIGVLGSAAVAGSSFKETDGTGTTSYTNVFPHDQDFVEEDPNNAGYPNIRADLSAATGPDIIEFREALGLQRYQEARARFGSDYVDYLRYLGINPSDGRLQKPEFLGAGRTNVQFSEVLNTSNTNTGDFAGHGIAAMRSNKYRRFFQEHGWVISVMYVRPRSIYTQGIHRKFTKTTKEQYFQKELELIGAEEVQNREIYAPHTTPEGTFGYAPRYSDYRSEPSRVSSEFRNSLSYDWHLGRIFASDPALNQTFIECDPSKRVFAEQANDSLWVMVNHNLRARRMVGKAGMARII